MLAARLYGRKSTGGTVELLIERLLSPRRALAQVRASKSPKPGGKIVIGETTLQVVARQGEFFELKLVAGLPLR